MLAHSTFPSLEKEREQQINLQVKLFIVKVIIFNKSLNKNRNYTDFSKQLIGRYVLETFVSGYVIQEAWQPHDCTPTINHQTVLDP